MNQPETSPYERLLLALGDSCDARKMINEFAHHLADTVKAAEETQYPGPASAVIDPFQHTRETWSAVTRCLAIATPFTDTGQAVTAIRAAAGTQPQPAVVEPEDDEQRADREETERDHATGDHGHCAVTCEVEMPSDMLRNFIVAKGYPGTAGALNELLRRAAGTQPAADEEQQAQREYEKRLREQHDVDVAENARLRAELAKTRTQFAEVAATVAEQVQRYGRRMREHNADREEIVRLRAELEQARGAVLSEPVRQFLDFALDQAADRMAERSNEFDAGDRAALVTLRHLADDAQQAGHRLPDTTESA